MLDILMIASGCILSAFLGSFVTRWLLTRKTAYGHFYLEELDPDSPGEFLIRMSIPSVEYYLNKNQIILKRGDSQNKQGLK